MRDVMLEKMDMDKRIQETGYLASFNVRNVPVYIHWSFPVGGIFIAFFLGDPSVEKVRKRGQIYLLANCSVDW